MPYFRFEASTPYCGEEITEYHEVGEDELDSVDEVCSQLANDVADMFWDGEFENEEDEESTDGTYTQSEYYAECSCVATELTKEEYLDEGGILKN